MSYAKLVLTTAWRRLKFPIGHEHFKLQMSCPNSVFRATEKTDHGVEVTATRQLEDQSHQ